MMSIVDIALSLNNGLKTVTKYFTLKETENNLRPTANVWSEFNLSFDNIKVHCSSTCCEPYTSNRSTKQVWSSLVGQF